MREVVFGVEDGTVQNMALVAGMVGAALSNRIIVIAAAINAISGVLSMAMGTYLSSKAERDVALAHGDAGPARFTPERDAMVMAGAYAGGALIPLLPFAVGLPRVGALWTSMAIAAATLFSLGVAKAVASHQGRVRAGAEMLLLASAAGLLGYGLGILADTIFGAVL
jgi:VIT1/CCC1 family predicted Fe2+/Mn2+ transporter